MYIQVFCLCFLPISVLSWSWPWESPKKCRALALEGGGDAGAWQAGVIAGMIENLPANEVQYEVISGVSVGSINGLFISTFGIGEEKQMVEELIRRWSTLTRGNIYTPWSGHYITMVEAFFNKPSFFDNSPLKEMLDNYMQNKTIKRKLSIGITDATDVEAITFDLEDFPKENITQLVLDSTSMPVMFPYQSFEDNKMLIDGGVLLNVNVHSAVRRCREMGYKDENIIIDAILPTGAQIDKIYTNESYTGYQMYKRYKQIVEFRAALDDIIHAYYDFRQVTFRYIIMPSKPIPSHSIPLSFDHSAMMKMIDMGKEDAKLIIKNPEITGLDQILKRKMRNKYQKYKTTQ